MAAHKAKNKHGVVNWKRGLLAGKVELAKAVVASGSIKNFAYRNPRITDMDKSLIEQNLNDPEVINYLLRTWKKRGISLDLASKVHFQALTSPAKRWRGSDKLKAVEMTYRGHGIKEFAKDVDSIPARSILQIFIDQRKQRGLSLPEGVIDADSR